MLTYGCQLWWGGRFTKSNAKRLQVALNGSLRLVCRAFKTTSTQALQYISHIAPITHIIHKICYSSSIRLHRLLPNSPVLQRIKPPRFPAIHLVNRNANTTNRLAIPSSKLSPLQRIAQLTNATSFPTLNPIYNPPWEEQMKDHPQVRMILPPPKDQREIYNTEITTKLEGHKDQEEVLVVATDGSRRKTHGSKRTGAGIFISYQGEKLASVSIGLGRRTNSYDGESLALTAGMRLALRLCKERPNITTIQFYSDSSSALTNILETTAHPTQILSLAFIKNAKEFLQSNNHQIVLQWIPGHFGHTINEHADRLTKRGCRKEHELLDNTLSYHAERRSRLVSKHWRKEFRQNPPSGAFGEVTYYPPTTKPNKVFLQLETQPEVFGRLTQVKTMHGYNPHFYARFNIEHNPDCICGHRLPPFPARNFRDHILHNCEEYNDQRHILTSVSRDHQAPILLGSIKGLLATAKFLKESGAFTLNGRPYEPPPPHEIPGLQLNEPP